MLEKFDAGNCSEEEIAILETWYLNWQKHSPVVIDDGEVEQSLDRIWNRLQKSEPAPTSVLPNRFMTWALRAAAVILLVGISLYLYNVKKDLKINSANYSKDIMPGGNKAFITLANGRTISLSNLKSGLNVRDKQLRYNDGTKVEEVAQDLALLKEGITLRTPRGGTYQIVLQDGTRVWLNAESSLTYHHFPDVNGNRVVNLKGEAYFEVAKDKVHPFIVHGENQNVKVLGTHFNICNYDDDHVARTTLLEGSIKINDTILMPGQQSVISNKQIKIMPADIEQSMAWMNDDFVLNGETFKNTMQKIARWYDVDVVYKEGVAENVELGGWVSRKSKLSEVLHRIEQAGKVHLKLEGRQVIVEK